MSTITPTDESQVQETNAVSKQRAEGTPSVLTGGEISLLDLLVVLVKHRRKILLGTIIAAVITIVVVLIIPKQYTGEAIILTPVEPSSLSAAMMGGLGGTLAGLSSAGDTLGLKDPNDKYIAMLKSRVVAEDLIKRFNLQPYYDAPNHVELISSFLDDANISSGHDGTITIDFLHKDPKIAADIANAFVEQLQKLSQQMAVTEASQRRIFFLKQFEKVKDELANAEVELRKSQENSGMLDLDKQASVVVGTIAGVQGQIMGQEILIRGLMSNGTLQNPDVIRAKQQLATMKAQLAELERKSGGAGNGEIMIATGKLPAAGLEYLRKFRNVKYYEAIYEILAKQYEAALVDESTNGALVQVIAPAVPQDKKTKPKRALLVIAATVLAFLFMSVWAFFLELYRRLSNDRTDGPKVRFLTDSIRWRKLFARAG